MKRRSCAAGTTRGKRTSAVEEAARLIDTVAHDPAMVERYPHQVSGGQLERVAIARALAARLNVVILDEVTSVLEVSVQATIINLLRRLQGELRLSYLCIWYNPSVVFT